MTVTLSTENLFRILDVYRAPCVSIYMPTHRHHPGTQQDPIRFKTLLALARKLLRAECSDHEAAGILGPAEALSNSEFWKYQEDGLAVLLCPGQMDVFKLPQACREIAVVSTTPHVKPLVHHLRTNRGFYVLSLSQKAVRLFQGAKRSLSEIPLDLSGMGEFVPKKRSGKQVDSRSLGGGDSVYYGNTGEVDQKADLERYFRYVDEAVHTRIKWDHSPLVLAAVNYYHPLYRSLSKYPHLLERGLEGSFDRTPAAELHKAVFPIVEEELRKQEEKILSNYHAAALAGKGTDELTTVAREAVGGRVSTLLLAESNHVWGILNRETGEIAVKDRQENTEDADILDDICEVVLRKGGDVWSFAGSDLPASGVAAIFRF